MLKITDTLATHMVAVWKAMEEDSEEREDYRIYVGRLSQLTKDLGISMSYYSKIFRALYEGSYAALEDRGGRDKPSTVILLREPKKVELLALTLDNPGPIISLTKRLDAIESSLGGIYVLGAFKNLEGRIEELEKQIVEKSVTKQRKGSSGKTA